MCEAEGDDGPGPGDVANPCDDLALYRDLPRFFRLTRCSPGFSAAELEAHLGATVRPVSWLPDGYFTVDAGVRIAQSPLFQKGELHGIDGSSIAAVLAMDLQPGDRVLDVACAPGTKLCLMADLVGGTNGVHEGLAVGVDSRLPRLFIARSQAAKHRLRNVRLVWGDGTRYHPLAPTDAVRMGSPFWAADGRPGCVGDRRRFRKAFGRLQERLSAETAEGPNGLPASVAAILNGPPAVVQELPDAGIVVVEPDWAGAGAAGLEPLTFDAVLVDPESSHDHDVRRLDKLLGGGLYWNAAPPDQEAKLCEYQFRLLRQGWHLLRRGGVLVYTTCSSRPAQNEVVVRRLIAEEPGEVELVEAFPAALGVPHTAGLLPGTAHFSPHVSATGGCFVAKLRKRLDAPG